MAGIQGTEGANSESVKHRPFSDYRYRINLREIGARLAQR
jgi:hypothetical protein